MIGMKQTKLLLPEARRVRGKSTPPLQQPGLIQVTVFQVTVFLGMGRVVLDWVGSRWVGSGFCGLDWVGVIELGWSGFGWVSWVVSSVWGCWVALISLVPDCPKMVTTGTREIKMDATC